MSNFYIVPATARSGAGVVALGIFEACDGVGHKVDFFKPISQNPDAGGADPSTSLAGGVLKRELPAPLSAADVESQLAKGGKDEIVGKIVENFAESAKEADVTIIEGLAPDDGCVDFRSLNVQIARNLSARIICVVDCQGLDAKAAANRLKICLLVDPKNVFGYVLTGIEGGGDPASFAEEVHSLLDADGKNLVRLGALGEAPVDLVESVKDAQSLRSAVDFVAKGLDGKVLKDRLRTPRIDTMAPELFKRKMIERARAANKRIVLPEGDEPRTIRAAIECHRKGIARCVLLAKREKVEEQVRSMGLELPSDVEILDPETIKGNYVDALVEMRKSKGLTPEQASKLLEDSVYIGTMMLALDEVDGLVSGAVHTTANTIRPALQLIKTDPDSSLVSSVFFMLMPEQVYVYGDCAVNPKPTAQELADIAIQSYESALAFGIDPKVAMISYSTGASGQGEDVDKVQEATALVKSRRPDVVVDGPLQYDAATVESVGKQKAPGSPVAGRATVFVFPDLNTGNCTYKAVQRSAGVLSVGPMLQGLRKPVNDLSRGALVGDIVYTIALTAIQAVAKSAK